MSARQLEIEILEDGRKFSSIISYTLQSYSFQYLFSILLHPMFRHPPDKCSKHQGAFHQIPSTSDNFRRGLFWLNDLIRRPPNEFTLEAQTI
jgi:hypothetical protein